MAYIGPGIDNGYRSRFIYTATAGQTSFSGGDANGITLTYTDSEYLDVYQNGVLLVPGDDYAATTGTTVVLVQGASLNDKVEMIQYQAFGVADTVSRADGGAFGGNISTSGTLTVTGNADLNGAVDMASTLQVDGAITSSAGATITTADNTAQLVLKSTDADANVGPVLDLRRDSSSPADGDAIGRIRYRFDNDNGDEETAIFLDGTLADASDGTEDASFKIQTKVAGTARNRIDITSSEIVFNEDSIDSDFRVESNTNDRSFVVDGADGIIYAGTSHTNIIAVDNRYGILLNHNSQAFQLGVSQFSANGGAGVQVNRDADDGSLVNFNKSAQNVGSISNSGGTVSYNAFTGSHWSRFSNNSKPTILVGTVMETIDEMCDWYQAEFEVEDGGTARVSISLPSGKSVGDTITQTFEGSDYTATIVKELDNKHTKCKISDTADSKRVYGVHSAWDNDDDLVNDMYVSAVGTHVVRINGSITVSAGDLLVSNGDGTAKKLSGDTSMTADVYSSIIGKVLTNIKQETYDDDSYTVPCALYCG